MKKIYVGALLVGSCVALQAMEPAECDTNTGMVHGTLPSLQQLCAQSFVRKKSTEEQLDTLTHFLAGKSGDITDSCAKEIIEHASDEVIQRLYSNTPFITQEQDLSGKELSYEVFIKRLLKCATKEDFKDIVFALNSKGMLGYEVAEIIIKDRLERDGLYRDCFTQTPFGQLLTTDQNAELFSNILRGRNFDTYVKYIWSKDFCVDRYGLDKESFQEWMEVLEGHALQMVQNSASYGKPYMLVDQLACCFETKFARCANQNTDIPEVDKANARNKKMLIHIFFQSCDTKKSLLKEFIINNIYFKKTLMEAFEFGFIDDEHLEKRIVDVFNTLDATLDNGIVVTDGKDVMSSVVTIFDELFKKYFPEELKSESKKEENGKEEQE